MVVFFWFERPPPCETQYIFSCFSHCSFKNNTVSSHFDLPSMRSLSHWDSRTVEADSQRRLHHCFKWQKSPLFASLSIIWMKLQDYQLNPFPQAHLKLHHLQVTKTPPPTRLSLCNLEVRGLHGTNQRRPKPQLSSTNKFRPRDTNIQVSHIRVTMS